jgi:hypothetical protein
MKMMKWKVLAAAVGFALASQASAAVVDPINGPGGYGSLVLNVWNGTSKYVRNLGTIDTWLTNNSNGTFTQSAYANASHTFFDGGTLGSASSSSSVFDTLFTSTTGVLWNVMAAFTDFTLGQYNGVASTGSATLGMVTQGVETGVSNNATLMGNLNGSGPGNAAGEYNATSISVAGAFSNSYFSAISSGSTSAAIGSSMQFFGIVDDLATASTTPSARTPFAGMFSLASDGTLTYSVAAAAVPLPGALWLLASGLFGFFAVGRRKSA